MMGVREHIGRTLTALDQVMLAIKAEHAQHPRRYHLPDWLSDSAFFSGMAVQVTLVDDRGLARASSLGPITGIVDLSDRPHIRHHLRPDAPQPYISEPVLGRVSGKWSIQVSRRLEAPDSSFAGVLVVSIDPDYFVDFFRTLSVGEHGVVVLLGRDGVVRARHAPGESAVGRNLTRLEHLILPST
jgi:hypothetical protein